MNSKAALMKKTGIIWIILLSVILIWTGCKKAVEETRPEAALDRVSLSFGNTVSSRQITITNQGEKTLNYVLTEDIPWLEIQSSTGEVEGLQSRSVTVNVDRTELEKNRYSGNILLETNDRNITIPVYMAVDMFLVTVINPAFTTIRIETDSAKAVNAPVRLISPADSTQFAYFDAPTYFIFTANTSGVYGDSTQVGLLMEWKDIYVVKEDEIPRIVLNVPEEYFFLRIINTFETLNPLYVNSGTPQEMVENIFIYQKAEPQTIGYYHALPNTVIRGFEFNGSSSIVWINGDQFDFPFTVNQRITLESYLSDSLKTSAFKSKLIQDPGFTIDRNYGDVIDFFSTAK